MNKVKVSQTLNELEEAHGELVTLANMCKEPWYDCELAFVADKIGECIDRLKTSNQEWLAHHESE